MIIALHGALGVACGSGSLTTKYFITAAQFQFSVPVLPDAGCTGKRD
jgi:hypothetical protein